MRISTQRGEGTLLLRCERIELHSFSPENLTEGYIGWLRDRQLMRFSNQRFSEHNMMSCQAYLDSFSGTENLFIAIYHEGNFIGTMTAYRSTVHSTVDMGLLIGSEWQGKGLGRDAWSGLMAHLLATGTRKVTGGTLRCNAAMLGIMQRCEMQPDGVRIGQELVDGIAHDILYFAKFAESESDSHGDN
jgi:RimJ/RimL family protein N-acetyltransferase